MKPDNYGRVSRWTGIKSLFIGALGWTIRHFFEVLLAAVIGLVGYQLDLSINAQNRSAALYGQLSAQGSAGWELQDLAFNVREGQGGQGYQGGLPILAKAMSSDSVKVRKWVSDYIKSMRMVSHCLEAGLCDESSVDIFFRDDVLETFFAISPLIYCDKSMADRYKESSGLEMMELLVAHFLEEENRIRNNKNAPIFMTFKEFDEATLNDEEKALAVIVRAGWDRPLCEDYRKELEAQSLRAVSQ